MERTHVVTMGSSLFACTCTGDRACWCTTCVTWAMGA